MRKNQQGNVLIIGLLISLVITMVVVATVNSGLMQTSITTNAHITTLLETASKSTIEKVIYDAENNLTATNLLTQAAQTTPELFPQITKCLDTTGTLVNCNNNITYASNGRNAQIQSSATIKFICETIIDDDIAETIGNQVAMKKVFLITTTSKLIGSNKKTVYEQLISIKGPSSDYPVPCTT